MIQDGRHRILTVLFLIAGIAAGLCYLLTGTIVLRFIFKPIPILLMVARLLLNRRAPDLYRRTVTVGLILGAFADVVIMANFVAGLVVFLLAHIVYIIAFLEDDRRCHPRSAIPALLYALLVYSGLLYFGDMGAMAVPVVVYALVISAMLWRSLARLGTSGLSRQSILAGIIGAVLFVLSDSILVVNLFVVKIPAASWFIMLPYWAGQGGIFLSALWRDSDRQGGSFHH